MKTTVALWILLMLPATSLLAVAPDDEKENHWHQWRGPRADGSAPRGNPPVNWSATKNLKWKTEIDGRGSSTPIVWGDKVFVLTAIKTDRIDPKLPKPEDQPQRLFGIKHPNAIHQFVVVCLNRHTGKQLWRRVATERVPHEGHHPDNNFASASPTTDGERLYVWFGSPGLFCYDLDGKLLWKRDLGNVSMRRSFGEGCSPVVRGDRLIINRDNDGQSYIAVLDTKSGRTLWQVKRDETSAWATPLVVEANDRVQIITNASNRVRSYDLADGSVIWECGGQVGNVTPSPVLSDGLVICMSGYRGNALFAIPLDSTGDVTDTDKIAWKADRGTPYVPSPLLYEGRLYFNQSNNSILTSRDARSGQIVIDRTRIDNLRRIYASPVGAAGRIYFVGRDGATVVLKHGDSYEVLATNRIGEDVDASPAIVGDQLLLRGRKHLWCFSASE